MSILIKGGGVTKLSELGIDVSKNWGAHLIKNLGVAVDDADAVTKVQAILQSVLTTKGDTLYRNNSEAVRLPLDYGSGWNFLHALDTGIGLPEWRDIQDLIIYLTGAVNRWVAPPVLAIPDIPGISVVVAEDHSGGGHTATPSLTIAEPLISASEVALFDQRYDLGDDADLSVWGANWEAQTFTVNVAHDIEIIEIKCRRVLLPGDVTIGIRDTALDLPDGADLVNITFSGNDLLLANAWISRYVAAQGLLAATKYAIVIRAPGGDAANYLVWRTDGTAPGYAGGARCHSANGGVGWAEDVNNDFMFREGEVH